MPLAIWALAMMTFGIGITEFSISGLLPFISHDFSISIDDAGYAATVYALGVFIFTPIIVILGAKVPQKKMLLILVSFFIIGNLVTAWSPYFFVTLIGRFITSLAHGAFIGIGSLIAVELCKGRETAAISFMFSGLTLSTLIGTPLVTYLGYKISWHFVFYMITFIGVVAFIAVAKLVPSDIKKEDEADFNLAREFAVFKDMDVLIALAITVLGPAAFFTSITYIAPVVTHVAGLHDTTVSIVLFVFGLGLCIGNTLGGKLAVKSLMPVLLFSLLLQAIMLLILYFMAANQWVLFISVFLIAAFGFATVSPIQHLVMTKARQAGAANLISSFNIGMFNLGNALGAWIGGLTIAYQFGYSSPNFAGAILSIAAFLLALVSYYRGRIRNTSSVV
ncbi:putative transmembrane efflux protein [Commensalibacter intestini A911]|uniref:MFS transporter n=2 Tax=Commensalibacter intestini TaxID=479936 RepID=A0A251ZUJ3_9PROT|nr:MFS transporter [Commensalibacter intestini]EHD14259.1 putative transmembrane efflux protein [Commensalibacter intestini A911]OUI78346.1 MFS transporter [Commensalibacter intestini]